MARSWRAFFESLASHEPLIVVFEDIHWADPGLLGLFESLATRVSRPILFLCLSRPEVAERSDRWPPNAPNATRLALSPLSDAESAELVRGLLGTERLATEALEPVLERAEGNPFFAEELLRMLIEDGVLARRGDAWVLDSAMPASLPDTVQGVIAARIDALAASEKRVIQDAAVVGRIFWDGAVSDLESEAATTAIDALIAKDLVAERHESAIEGQRELIFSHVLTRDVAYTTIPRARRASAHAAVGAWIERVTSGRTDEFAEILAHHFERAGDSARLARYAVLAGDRQLRLFAAREAVRWFERAASAVDSLDGDDQQELDYAIARGRGQALTQLGRLTKAEPELETALRIARELGEGAREVHALADLVSVYWLEDRYAQGDRFLSSALDRAREIGAAEIEARLLYRAGTLAFGRGRGRWSEALAAQAKALDVARRSDDREAQALALHGLTEIRFFTGPFDDAVSSGLEARALLRDLDLKPLLYENETNVNYVLYLTGHLDEALESCEEAVRGTRAIGDLRNQVFAQLFRSRLSHVVGDLGAAAGQRTRPWALRGAFRRRAASSRALCSRELRRFSSSTASPGCGRT